MNKNDFAYIEDRGVFEAAVNGMEISVGEDQMSDEVLEFAEKVLNEYPRKIAAISEYLSKDDGIAAFYDNISKEEIAEKLHEPSITIFEGGGQLSYLNHELDSEHIIDLEFSGVLEEFFYASIDG